MDEPEIHSIGLTTTSLPASYSNSSGISSLASCASIENFPELPTHDEERLQRAAKLLQQRFIFRQWLSNIGLLHHHHRLLQEDVTSLEDVYWLEDNRAKQLLGKDFTNWSKAREALPINKEHLAELKSELWSTVVKSSQHQDAWTYGGMLVVSVSIAGLVTLAAMTQPSLAPQAKHSLLQYVTGKYLLPTNCRFYQRNGQPYPICDKDNLCIEVSEGPRRVATLIELGGREPSSANLAVVKFTVRHAGQYRILVLIGNIHVQGSPFYRTFLPGPPDPLKTGFVRQSSTVICTAKLAQILSIEPRDEFSNLCQFSDVDDPAKGYVAEISQQGSKPFPVIWKFEYDKSSLNIKFEVLFLQEGIYQVKVLYQGEPLHNGEFDCIVLNVADAALVRKNVSDHNTCYEARLLKFQGETLLKPKKVVVYISPKQLTIKEFLLKFIPKRLVTFRLCPSTKFHFQNESNQTSLPVFSIDDGCQPEVELMSKDRNVIAASFTYFLLKNIGGSETFKDKQEFFYHEVRRYHHKHYHEKLLMKVNRHKLLESSIKATKGFSVADWCRNFEIDFQGEQGIDWGGLRREWFQLICAALFEPKNQLFKGFSDSLDKQALVHPNTKRPPHLKLKHYEFAGRVVGKCLYESALGGGYRQLYFEQDDPDLYLTKVKYILEHDVNDMDLYFTEEDYDQSGQLVQLLLCGTGEYSIADFKANHIVNGSSPEFRRLLEWFWTTVSNFTTEEMARLLQFTTGSSQLPAEGFKELSPKFQLTPAPTFGSLPTAHTCFNQLCLPDYDTYEQFEKALLLAISEGTEGFGMI
ncbi:unnamed protein product [Bemisia tabaci]|uniref:HECT-type E3 ubiquitin transferase n=1 Tax=Bemisia tabaci TaxID=7038 RepID=A0A9P0CGJ8_BEMTA|nr:unnamed protein product [Bemisia tabaci]